MQAKRQIEYIQCDAYQRILCMLFCLCANGFVIIDILYFIACSFPVCVVNDALSSGRLGRGRHYDDIELYTRPSEGLACRMARVGAGRLLHLAAQRGPHNEADGGFHAAGAVGKRGAVGV